MVLKAISAVILLPPSACKCQPCSYSLMMRVTACNCYIYASAFDCLHVSIRNMQPALAACRKQASQQSINRGVRPSSSLPSLPSFPTYLFFFFFPLPPPISVPPSFSPSILCSAAIPASLTSSVFFLLTFFFHLLLFISPLLFSSFISPSASLSLSLAFLLVSPLFHPLSSLPPLFVFFPPTTPSDWLLIPPLSLF